MFYIFLIIWIISFLISYRLNKAHSKILQLETKFEDFLSALMIPYIIIPYVGGIVLLHAIKERKKERKEKKCIYCGKVIERDFPPNVDNRFCNSICYDEYMRHNTRNEENISTLSRDYRHCRNCGCTFDIDEISQKRDEEHIYFPLRYCSRLCFEEHMNSLGNYQAVDKLHSNKEEVKKNEENKIIEANRFEFLDFSK